MFDATLENSYGDRLKLTGNNCFNGIEIDGLYPAPATINTSETALFDGGRYISSKTNVKQIIITFYIDRNVEENRISLYRVVQPKEFLRLRYKNNTRNVYIDGYVEGLDIEIFSMKQFVTISMLCPDPYFKDANYQLSDVNVVTDMFTYPFAITENEKIPMSYYSNIKEVVLENGGDVISGMEIELHATGTVRNPIIYDRVTNEFFKLEYTLSAGEVVYISTYKGRKTAKTLKNGVYVNVFNTIASGSTWLQLKVGTNVLNYDADVEDEDYLTVKFIFQNLYRGV